MPLKGLSTFSTSNKSPKFWVCMWQSICANKKSSLVKAFEARSNHTWRWRAFSPSFSTFSHFPQLCFTNSFLYLHLGQSLGRLMTQLWWHLKSSSDNGCSDALFSPSFWICLATFKREPQSSTGLFCDFSENFINSRHVQPQAKAPRPHTHISHDCLLEATSFPYQLPCKSPSKVTLSEESWSGPVPLLFEAEWSVLTIACIF